MNWKLVYRVYRPIATIFSVVILIMVIIAIIPVATKNVNVESIGNATWHLDGDILNISVPVTLKNGGYFDIKNITVMFRVNNHTATFLNSKQLVGDIKSGSERTVNIVIPVNLTHILKIEEPHYYHFFHSDVLNVKFTVFLRYMLNMVYFQSTYSGVLNWEPIVKDFKVHHPSKIHVGDKNVNINIPFSITTASYLSGTAKFDGSVSGTNFTGTFNSKFGLGGKHDSTLNLSFEKSASQSLLTHTQTLYLEGYLSISEVKVPMHFHYLWGAPLNNLHVEVLSNKTVHYSFENDADFGMHLTIKRYYYYHSTLVKEESEIIDVQKGEHINRYDKINVSEPVDKVVITINDDTTGIHYEKVINL